MRTLVLLLMLTSLPAAAEVYRWRDAQGNIHYGDRAPQGRAQPAKLPPLQFISGQDRGSGAGNSTKSVRHAHAQTIAPAYSIPVRVVSPLADAVSLRADRRLPIQVALDRPLPEGSGLIYRVDGNPAHRSPIKAASFTATEVDRGAHLVDVSVVDASGRELGRSHPILVHSTPSDAH